MLNPWQLFNQLAAREIPLWTFWLEGQWHTLEFPERISAPSSDKVAMSLEPLQRCGEINQILSTLPLSENRTQRQNNSRRIDKLLEQAIECELLNQSDRFAFVRQGLIQREGFWRTAKMQAFIAETKRIADLYRDETRHWDEQRWLEMTQPNQMRGKD